MAVILLYHAVSDLVTDSLLQVTPGTIRRHLDWLQRLGYEIAPLDTLLARSTERLAAITFDDGLTSIERPILELLEAKISPTVFVCGGLVGGENVWASPGRVRERLLDLDMLKAPPRSGSAIRCSRLGSPTLRGPSCRRDRRRLATVPGMVRGLARPGARGVRVAIRAVRSVLCRRGRAGVPICPGRRTELGRGRR